MLFHNANPFPLEFRFGDEVYKVPPGAQCEIERRFVPLVAKRGLLLTEGPAPTPAPSVEPSPAPRRNAFRPKYPDTTMTAVTREKFGLLEAEGIDTTDPATDDGLLDDAEPSEELDDAVAKLVKAGTLGAHRAKRRRNAE